MIEQCKVLGTVGDLILADFQQYAIAGKSPMVSAMSIHVRFTQDEVVMRFIYRAQGEPLWNTPITNYEGSDTQSPFVALQTRS